MSSCLNGVKKQGQPELDSVVIGLSAPLANPHRSLGSYRALKAHAIVEPFRVFIHAATTVLKPRCSGIDHTTETSGSDIASAAAAAPYSKNSEFTDSGKLIDVLGTKSIYRSELGNDTMIEANKRHSDTLNLPFGVAVLAMERLAYYPGAAEKIGGRAIREPIIDISVNGTFLDPRMSHAPALSQSFADASNRTNPSNATEGRYHTDFPRNYTFKWQQNSNEHGRGEGKIKECCLLEFPLGRSPSREMTPMMKQKSEQDQEQTHDSNHHVNDRKRDRYEDIFGNDAYSSSTSQSDIMDRPFATITVGLRDGFRLADSLHMSSSSVTITEKEAFIAPGHNRQAQQDFIQRQTLNSSANGSRSNREDPFGSVDGSSGDAFKQNNELKKSAAQQTPQSEVAEVRFNRTTDEDQTAYSRIGGKGCTGVSDDALKMSMGVSERSRVFDSNLPSVMVAIDFGLSRRLHLYRHSEHQPISEETCETSDATHNTQKEVARRDTDECGSLFKTSRDGIRFRNEVIRENEEKHDPKNQLIMSLSVSLHWRPCWLLVHLKRARNVTAAEVLEGSNLFLQLALATGNPRTITDRGLFLAAGSNRSTIDSDIEKRVSLKHASMTHMAVKSKRGSNGVSDRHRIMSDDSLPSIKERGRQQELQFHRRFGMATIVLDESAETFDIEEWVLLCATSAANPKLQLRIFKDKRPHTWSSLDEENLPGDTGGTAYSSTFNAEDNQQRTVHPTPHNQHEYLASCCSAPLISY